MANDVFIGAEGEITMDTVTKGLRIHDGSLRGGYKVPTLVAVQYPSATNNYIWYRKYSDGWVEQGGLLPHTPTGSTVTINLPVEMADANYTWNVGVSYNNSNTPPWYHMSIWNKTTTTFQMAQGDSADKCWEVKGMAA